MGAFTAALPWGKSTDLSHDTNRMVKPVTTVNVSLAVEVSPEAVKSMMKAVVIEIASTSVPFIFEQVRQLGLHNI